jgi:hypothetical protein
MVCVEYTIDTEVILDAPDGMGDVESHFFPFGDSFSVYVR